VKLKNLVPGWQFGIDEVSNGHYVLTGCDLFHHTVSYHGSDESWLIESGRDQAVWVSLQDKGGRRRFLYNYIGLRLGKEKISESVYDEKVFGSWYICVSDRKIIFDGKSFALILQEYNSEWKDLWVKPIESITVEDINKLIGEVH
jgi:hypothetical protein